MKWFLLLTLVINLSLCQSQINSSKINSSKNTSKYIQKSKTEVNWPSSTRYAQSRTASSRYDVYKPLEDYISRYGSSIRTNSSVSYTSTRKNIYKDNSYDRLGIFGRQPTTSTKDSKNNTPGSENKQISTDKHSIRTNSKISTILPKTPTKKLVTNTNKNPNINRENKSRLNPSVSLTHYSTLSERNKQKNVQKVSKPRRPFNNKKRPIKGEGYGNAYLEWSEYGIGKNIEITE